MRKLLATLTILFLFAAPIIVEAAASCPAEVKAAQDMLKKQSAKADESQAPRALAGAKSRESNAPRDLTGSQAPRDVTGSQAQARARQSPAPTAEPWILAIVTWGKSRIDKNAP